MAKLETVLAKIVADARAQVAAGREPDLAALEARIATAVRRARSAGEDGAVVDKLEADARSKVGAIMSVGRARARLAREPAPEPKPRTHARPAARPADQADDHGHTRRPPSRRRGLQARLGRCAGRDRVGGALQRAARQALRLRRAREVRARRRRDERRAAARRQRLPRERARPRPGPLATARADLRAHARGLARALARGGRARHDD